MEHEWTGNVRELANALEHAVILSEGGTIEPEHLPSSVTRARGGAATLPIARGERPMNLRELEMEVILQVLEKHKGDKPRAAAELGIALKTLYNKLNQYQARAQAG